jgi:hypothetical protein
MNCSEIKDLLSPYLDGELDRVSQQAVFRHLSGCPSCNYELMEMQKLVKLLAGLEEIDPPRDFSAKLNRLILERVGSKSILKRIYDLNPQSWLPIGAAAAIIIALAFSLNFWLVEPQATDVPTVAVAPQFAPVEKMTVPFTVDKPEDVSLTLEKGAGLADKQQVQDMVDPPAPMPPPTPQAALDIQSIQENAAFNVRSLPAPKEGLPDGKMTSRNGMPAGEVCKHALDAPLVEKWTISLSDIEEGYRQISGFSKNVYWNTYVLSRDSKKILLCLEGPAAGLNNLLSFLGSIGILEHRESIGPQLLLDQNKIGLQINEGLKAQLPQIKSSVVRIEVHLIVK